MNPYYEADGVTIYRGDCRDVLGSLDLSRFVCLLVDPPYGMDYRSNWPRQQGNARAIANDRDTSVRDAVLAAWDDRPALVFGSWKVARPAATRGVLVWDKGGALGMGDLSLPWKFDHEEIYVLGRGFVGRRDSGSVIHCPPVQAVGRKHPNEKPVELMMRLLRKCPPGPVLDPCCGVGPVLVAAKELGREAVGIEAARIYCAEAADRLGQRVLDLGAA